MQYVCACVKRDPEGQEGKPRVYAIECESEQVLRRRSGGGVNKGDSEGKMKERMS